MDTSDASAAIRHAGPRERRRMRTMLLIQGEALRLFAERGYEQTTIDEIAAASDISPRTFFRYFPTKEDVVLWDEYDVVIPDVLARLAASEGPLQTMLLVSRASIEDLHHRDRERLLARQRLVATVPAVRARFLEFTREGIAQLSDAIGGAADELTLRVTAIALVGALEAALDRWQRAGGEPDLMALVDEAIDALLDGVGELSQARRVSRLST